MLKQIYFQYFIIGCLYKADACVFFSLFLSVFSGPTAWISLKVDQTNHECVRTGLLYLDHSSNPIPDLKIMDYSNLIVLMSHLFSPLGMGT